MASSESKGNGMPNSSDASAKDQAAQKPLRSMASRAPLFDDLDEAFRKIASKQGSRPNLKADQQDKSKLNNTRVSSPSEVKPIGSAAPDTQDAIMRTSSPFVPGRSLTEKYKTPPKSIALAPQKCAEGESDKVAHGDGMVDVPLDRPDDTGSKNTQPARKTQHPSEPPKDSLPNVPHDHRLGDLKTKAGTVQAGESSTDSTVSNSQHLLGVDAQVNELRQNRHPFFPSPLKFPVRPGRKHFDAHKNDDFHSESSSADVSNGSNADPFRYDNQRYHNIMHSSNERDVSRALKRLSNVGEASESTIVTPEGSPCSKIAIQQPAITNDFAKRNQDKQPEGHQSVVSAKKIRDLRIQIQRKPELEPEEAGGQSTAYRLTRSKAHLRLNQLARESTGEGDWVTEATSDAGFGNSSLIKATGSSVADYSDEGDEQENVSTIVPRLPVLRHPPGKAQQESYELRTLKNTKKQQQVMVPKCKYSIFPTNSDKLMSKETSNSNQSLPRNPFSRNSYKRADTQGNFFSSSTAKGESKYEFRDSASEYALGAQLGLSSPPQGKLFDNDLENGALGKYLHDNGSENQTMASSRDVEITPRKPYEERYVDQMYPSRYKCGNLWRQEKESASFGQSSFIGTPLSTRSKFDFELVPLEEAQRKQKKQRESGESDETLPAGVRYQRSMSGSSMLGSSPITVPMPTLSREHERERKLAPHLSTDFSHQSWASLRDAFQDTPSPFSATSREQPTPASSAPNRSLLHHHSSPSDTSVTSNTPTRKFFGRYRRRLLCFPRRQARSRAASVHTTVQRDPLPTLESGLSIAGMEALMEANTSEDARYRRAHWFYLMATLSIILPFFAILVLTGVLDESLVWYTNGQVRQITIKQRNFIRNAFLAECCLYVILVAAIIAIFTKKL